MALGPEAAVGRWLDRYNSDKPWDDANFDGELADYLYLEAAPAVRLDIALALSRHPLSEDAKGLLGADICEDVLTEAPELLPRIRELVAEEPRLGEIMGHAWGTAEMTEEVRQFLREIHAARKPPDTDR